MDKTLEYEGEVEVSLSSNEYYYLNKAYDCGSVYRYTVDDLGEFKGVVVARTILLNRPVVLCRFKIMSV